MTDFPEWLNDELRKRSWNQSDLARRAGISRTAVSNVLSRKRQAGWEVCNAIARAFRLPAPEILRVAGLLPPLPIETPFTKEFKDLFSGLSPKDKEAALRYLRFLVQEQLR